MRPTVHYSKLISRQDECVTVKSPAKNIKVENIYCNWSGGCAMVRSLLHSIVTTPTHVICRVTGLSWYGHQYHRHHLRHLCHLRRPCATPPSPSNTLALRHAGISPAPCVPFQSPLLAAVSDLQLSPPLISALCHLESARQAIGSAAA